MCMSNDNRKKIRERRERARGRRKKESKRIY
jgi:hypothetical protein